MSGQDLTKNNSMLSKIIRKREIVILVIVVVAFIISAIVFPSFLLPGNLLGILLGVSLEAVMACGFLVLLIQGDIDLSIGSVVTFSGALCCSLMLKANFPTYLAVLVTLICCAAFGLFSGVLVAKIGVNAMVVTLAMMQTIEGIAILVCGRGIVSLPDDFIAIGQHKILGVQMPIWYMLIVLVIMAFLLKKTRFFRNYFFIGSNRKAAILSGINVEKQRMFSFVLSALLAGFSGIVYASRFGAASPATGSGMEFKVMTATVIGGASLSGGYGSVLGVIVGTLFMGLMKNIMAFAQVDGYWQSIVTGFVMLIAVTADVIINKRTESEN